MHEQSPAPAPVSPEVEAQARALRGRGTPLPDGLRASLERGSGRLLGHVRVHDDDLGNALAAAVEARAVTVGGDIALAAGEAGSAPGVLEHELAHAIQQTGTPAQGPLVVTSPGDAVEQDAVALLPKGPDAG